MHLNSFLTTTKNRWKTIGWIVPIQEVRRQDKGFGSLAQSALVNYNYCDPILPCTLVTGQGGRCQSATIPSPPNNALHFAELQETFPNTPIPSTSNLVVLVSQTLIQTCKAYSVSSSLSEQRKGCHDVTGE